MADPPARPTSVLVVEDDAILLEIVTTLFARAGLRVLTASDGEEALGILREKGAEIDWLFTDVQLPGPIDGWLVATEYRLSHPFRPVIYASTAAQRKERVVHGSLFVEKPFHPEEILRLAGMMLDSSLPPQAPA